MNTGKTLFSQLMDFLYLLVVIAKKELKIDRSMDEILQFLSIGLFENPPFFTGIYERKDHNFRRGSR